MNSLSDMCREVWLTQRRTRYALRGITIDSVAVTEADPPTPEGPDLFISRPGCGRQDHVDFIGGK